MQKSTYDNVFLVALVLFMGLAGYALKGKALYRFYAPEGTLGAHLPAERCQHVDCGRPAEGVVEVWVEAGTRRGNVYAVKSNYALCARHNAMAAAKKWPLRSAWWWLGLGALGLYAAIAGTVTTVVLVHFPLRALGLVPGGSAEEKAN